MHVVTTVLRTTFGDGRASVFGATAALQAVGVAGPRRDASAAPVDQASAVSARSRLARAADSKRPARRGVE